MECTTILPYAASAGDLDESGTPLDGVSEPSYLKAGDQVGRCEVRALLATGGFSAVYRAYDFDLGREVALKEFLPASLAVRDSGLVVPRSADGAALFEAGLQSFRDEATLLMRLRHPALVGVHRFWQQSGTAYSSMQLCNGLSLAEHVRRVSAPPGEKWLRRVLQSLAEALSVVHAAGWLHRDMSPSNVMLRDDGNPLLLDFGAACPVLAVSGSPQPTFVTRGYSPIEQYDDTGLASTRQGPWSDVYALAATACRLITGHAPPPAPLRSQHDTLVPLAQQCRGRYPARLLEALDQALAVQPQHRPDSVAAFIRLGGLSHETVAACRAPRALFVPWRPWSGLGTLGAAAS